MAFHSDSLFWTGYCASLILSLLLLPNNAKGNPKPDNLAAWIAGLVCGVNRAGERATVCLSAEVSGRIVDDGMKGMQIARMRVMRMKRCMIECRSMGRS